MRSRLAAVLVAAALALAGCASTPDEPSDAAGTIGLLLPSPRPPATRAVDRPYFEAVAELRRLQGALRQRRPGRREAAAAGRVGARPQGAEVLVLDPVDAEAAVASSTEAERRGCAGDRLRPAHRRRDSPTTSRSTTSRSASCRARRSSTRSTRGGDEHAGDPDGERRRPPTPTRPCSRRAPTRSSTEPDRRPRRVRHARLEPGQGPGVGGRASSPSSAAQIDGVYAANDGIAGGAIAALPRPRASTRPARHRAGRRARRDPAHHLRRPVHDRLQGDRPAGADRRRARRRAAARRGRRAPRRHPGRARRQLLRRARWRSQTSSTVIVDGHCTRTDEICVPAYTGRVRARGPARERTLERRARATRGGRPMRDPRAVAARRLQAASARVRALVDVDVDVHEHEVRRRRRRQRRRQVHARGRARRRAPARTPARCRRRRPVARLARRRARPRHRGRVPGPRARATTSTSWRTCSSGTRPGAGRCSTRSPWSARRGAARPARRAACPSVRVPVAPCPAGSARPSPSPARCSASRASSSSTSRRRRSACPDRRGAQPHRPAARARPRRRPGQPPAGDLQAVADRILVLRLGRDHGVFDGDASYEDLLAAMTGDAGAPVSGSRARGRDRQGPRRLARRPGSACARATSGCCRSSGRSC